MSEYKYVLYEPVATTARSCGSCSTGPDARNAQNRGMLVELNEAMSATPKPTTRCAS